MVVSSVLERVATTGPVRGMADGLLRFYANRRYRHLDCLSAAAVQRQTLLKLVRFAANTRFGVAHDFASVRTVEDYQRRVPLRDYEAFWREYWRPAFPDLENLSWPGAIPYFALSSGTTTGTTKFIPVSRAMLASNRRAAFTMLAWFLAAYPKTPLLSGRLFFLGGSTDLQKGVGSRLAPSSTATTDSFGPNDSRPLFGDLSGIAAWEVSPFLRPFTFPPLDVALLGDWEQKVQILAERSAALPITLISGVPSWLLVLFDRLRRLTDRPRLAEIWPTLRVVVHGGTSFQPYRSLFRSVIGSDEVRFVETYPASEGFVAAEDPRHQMLRLVPDHDVFFEFVPVTDLGKDRPARHTLADVLPGVPYAVVLTTCAGLWSYVIGDTVCFEKRDPPLLRFTGRTRHFLSAFGEHLISEEIERAIAWAAQAAGAAVADFHVGPVFPAATRETGRHRYLVEFALPPADLVAFTRALDGHLCQSNADYQAHRAGDLTLLAPEVWPVRRGGFAAWLRSRGQLGGQHKVPRIDNTGSLTEELMRWLQADQSTNRGSIPADGWPGLSLRSPGEQTEIPADSHRGFEDSAPATRV